MNRKWLSPVVIGCTIVVMLAVGAQFASPKSSTPTPIASAQTSDAVTPTVATPVAVAGTDPLQLATIRAAAVVSPKVVEIRSASGLGSGEIYDAVGHIVTNFHVVSGGGTALQPPFSVTLSNGKRYDASVTGTDPADDLAVLQIKAGTLKPIALGNSTTLLVGQFVLAVGNPLGFSQSVTFGIISTLNRGLPESESVYLPDLIQTSAPINPGNSGGALVDLTGRLVGIPTLSATTGEQGTAAQGLGFAIPVNRVKYVADQIIKYGRVVTSGRGYLGVSGADVTPQLQAQYGLAIDHGVLVTSVVPGGPAANAGIKEGDILVTVNTSAIEDTAGLQQALANLTPGKKVNVEVVRSNGSHSTAVVTVGELPVPSGA